MQLSRPSGTAMLRSVQMTEYAGPDGLSDMQELVQRTWSPVSRLHLGDVAWERSVNARRSSANWRTAVWRDGDDVVAWGWLAQPGHLLMTVDPGRPELAATVVEWFQATADGPQLAAGVLETERHLLAALESAGFQLVDDAPYYTHHWISLDALAEPVVPEGLTLRHVQQDEVAKRAAAHRAAWSDLAPSKVTDDDMAEVMSTWPYRPELDWVVENEAGDFVASALIWLDEQHQVGLVEPVGCAPEYRRRGLGAAVNLAALHALREAGGTKAVVCPRGDDGYPQARALYQSFGFRPGSRTLHLLLG
ncbi:ribosomal protein S18 acetylase RimI-like enzyme [Kribbella rubisoli]|uniref:Ribosomal protein S18 acetylase RimI-like enzyme n=2 Tax=Kribbella rubisoli TaxID=3075929 RepID=A0A4Q7X9L0_9ACTN|nr:ribosomal protein S18 acetylase RimI-like enzyme [Kribbella rubisoli]